MVGKQTYKQLAVKHNLSIKTIQRRLDKVKIAQLDHLNHLNNLAHLSSSHTPSPIYLIIDTTYFGRNFGLMVFMDNVS